MVRIIYHAKVAQRGTKYKTRGSIPFAYIERDELVRKTSESLEFHLLPMVTHCYLDDLVIFFTLLNKQFAFFFMIALQKVSSPREDRLQTSFANHNTPQKHYVLKSISNWADLQIVFNRPVKKVRARIADMILVMSADFEVGTSSKR